MAAITATLVRTLDASSGTRKIKIFTMTPEADGDTVALATWFSSVESVIVVISAGMDAALSFVQGVASGTSVTVTELEADGTAATDWTGAELTMWVEGVDEAITTV